MNCKPDEIAAFENSFYFGFTAKIDPESGNLYILCSTADKAAAILKPQTLRGITLTQQIARKAVRLGIERVEVFAREPFMGDMANVYKGSFLSSILS